MRFVYLTATAPHGDGIVVVTAHTLGLRIDTGYLSPESEKNTEFEASIKSSKCFGSGGGSKFNWVSDQSITPQKRKKLRYFMFHTPPGVRV
jgi:hypothetical protein